MRISRERRIPKVVVNAVDAILLHDPNELLADVCPPTRARGRAKSIVIEEFNQVLIARPFRAKVGIPSLDESARQINDDLHSTLVRHLKKLAEAVWVYWRILIRAQQPLRVVPLFVQLDQADPLVF